MEQLRMLLSLVFALFVCSVQPVLGSICNDGLCKCTREAQPPRTPTVVACGCNALSQELDLTSAMLASVSQARQFTVSDCKTLRFRRNAFGALHNLTKLSVKRVELVKFAPGVFSNLEALSLEGVRDLQLEPRAFMGIRDVFHIDIRDTNISELPEHVMYDAMGLRSIRFTNVTIGSIKTDAISIRLQGQESRFVMDNCTVMDIEEDGVRVSAVNVDIKDTLFGSIADHGINLTASWEVVVTGCEIQSGVNRSTLELAAPNINVSANTVNYLEIGALSNIHITSKRNFRGYCWLTNNKISQFNMTPLPQFNNIKLFEVVGNVIPCDCGMYDTISLILMMTNHPAFQNNFCGASCNVTLQEFSQKVSGGNVCGQGGRVGDTNPIDDTFLCDLPRTNTEDTLHSMTTRRGKAWRPITDAPHHDPQHGHATTTTAATDSSAAHVLSNVQLVVVTIITLIVTVK